MAVFREVVYKLAMLVGGVDVDAEDGRVWICVAC